MRGKDASAQRPWADFCLSSGSGEAGREIISGDVNEDKAEIEISRSDSGFREQQRVNVMDA